MLEKILVPVDGSEGGWKALSYAKAMADKFGSQLVVLTVMQPHTNVSILAVPVSANPVSEELLEVSKKVLDLAKEKIGATAAEFKTAVGRPSKVVVDMAKEEKVDLVVIGSRGLSGFAEFFLGSVSSEVVQLSPVPVFIVK